ncbi:MAG: tRNA (N6-isopentenyl adenosine(37)-C2)-methylthiotransferase MiaB [Lentisphaerae bacterium]|nr:tRNA (N6-isopentenyl adenosine(37)-C2)-methylthiotransferase MiaB [Lentisphaerota bacterium]
MNIKIITYGCQMNERDSERLAVFLQHQGHSLTSAEDEAQVFILNTCSVRAKAEAKALGKLRLLTASKAAYPQRIVGVVGCMVQRLGRDIFRLVRALDFAVGPRALARVPEFITAVAAGQQSLLDLGTAPDASAQDGHISGRATALISILFGCNRQCSYCIVPQVRGPEWSRPAEAIIAEAQRLVAGGVKEITLLGQSIMAYGRCQPVWPRSYRSPRGFEEPLPRLLEALQAIPALRRIRFTSNHPSGCTPELVRALVELPSVSTHLHLPLQSGSDRILGLMRRGYSVAEYSAGIQRVRSALPDLALTIDFIVGLPLETQAEFEMTRRLLAALKFDNAFIFKYSARPHTPAAQWPDDVDPAEKLRRNHVLLAEQNQQCLALNQKLVGRVLEVLIEGPSRRNPQRFSGRTRTNKIVLLEPGSDVRPGDLVRVSIQQAKMQTLYGRLASEDKF